MMHCQTISVVVKDLRFEDEDKNKDLMFEDKDKDKDLNSEQQHCRQ